MEDFDKTAVVARMKEPIRRAFTRLRMQGIIARQNYLCCSVCAGSSLEDKRALADARGWAFYHMQDNEGFLAGRTLYIGYGPHEDAAKIGAAVVEALKAEGLKPKWNGDTNVRIALEPSEHTDLT